MFSGRHNSSSKTENKYICNEFKSADKALDIHRIDYIKEATGERISIVVRRYVRKCMQ